MRIDRETAGDDEIRTVAIVLLRDVKRWSVASRTESKSRSKRPVYSVSKRGEGGPASASSHRLAMQWPWFSRFGEGRCGPRLDPTNGCRDRCRRSKIRSYFRVRKCGRPWRASSAQTPIHRGLSSQVLYAWSFHPSFPKNDDAWNDHGIEMGTSGTSSLPLCEPPLPFKMF